jgi:sulfite reductase alpha subunit-like flavoprotein
MLQDESAHVYICGDGAAMAKAVHSCLAGILEEHGGLSAEGAIQKLAAMTKEGSLIMSSTSFYFLGDRRFIVA